MIFSGGSSCCRERKLTVWTGIVLVLLAFPAFAGEPQVYTNQDLERYGDLSAYSEETVSRKEAELEQWEKRKQNEERLLREEEGSPGSDQGRKAGEEQSRRVSSARESGHDHAATKKKKRA